MYNITIYKTSICVIFSPNSLSTTIKASLHNASKETFEQCHNQTFNVF